ncbi:MAG: hypothetical protein WCF61_05775 [Terriglobales bacterium]
MKRLLLLICVLAGAIFAQGPPKTMTKIEVVLQSPDALAGSFAAKPRVFYRAGNQYCRVEEAPDPDQGIHGLMIINEPDYWMVNLFSKTARHGVDPGPTFNCRLAIFANGTPQSLDDESKQIMQLEFGRELEFFKGRGAIPKKGPVLQTKETIGYTIVVGTKTLALFTYGTPERPLAVSQQRNGKNYIYWYSGYGQMDFDPKLFAKPEGVKIEESK